MDTSSPSWASETADTAETVHMAASAGQAQGSALPPMATTTREPRATADGPLPSLFEMAGGDGGSLREALAAWQREQDRLANRAWRRPGGMVRLAGL
jgi:hypothetical protein